jgi:hypothetical protein
LLNVVGADISPLLAGLVLVAVLEVGGWLVDKNHVAWEMRGFEKLTGQWRKIHWFSAAISVVAALTAYGLTQNPVIFMILGIVSYVLAFSGWVDLITFKAPVEIFHLGLYALAPILVFGLLAPGLVPEREALFLGNDALFQFGFAAGLAALLFIMALLLGGLGLSDVRAFWVLAFGFGWWFGIGSIINLLLISAVLQVVVAVLGNIFKWGELLENPLRKGKKSRATPWLPMIALSYIVGPIVFLALS